MVGPSSRLATFTTNAWPAKVNPADLIEAGFFFLGKRDYTTRLHCDGGAWDWKKGDSPWVERARWHVPGVTLSS